MFLAPNFWLNLIFLTVGTSSDTVIEIYDFLRHWNGFFVVHSCTFPCTKVIRPIHFLDTFRDLSISVYIFIINIVSFLFLYYTVVFLVQNNILKILQ